MKFDSIKAVHFRWLGAILLALCIFLPLAKTPIEQLEEFNNQILIVDFYHSFMLRLKDNDIGLNFRFWVSRSAHMIILFIWPLVLLSIERFIKNRFLKFAIITIEIGLSLYTLISALLLSYLIFIYGSLHIGSTLALLSFGTYLTASIISMVKSQKKKKESAY